MPTLQEMHKQCAASPASSSDFWLLRMELAYRHCCGIDAVRIGWHRLNTSLHLREDHLATSGTVGLTGLGESSLAPGEGQGRGFEHAHSRNTAYPKGHLAQRDILRAASASKRTRAAVRRVEAQGHANRPVGAATPDRVDTPDEDASPAAGAEAATPTLSPAAVRYNEALIQYTATRQYESSVLPGKQLGLHLAPSAVHALATTTKQI